MIDKKKFKNAINKSQKAMQNAPTDQSMTVDVKNEELEAQIKVYTKEKTRENLNQLIEIARKCRLLVPANLNEQNQPVPCLLNSQENGLFFPAYTSKEQIPQEPKSPAIINMPYLAINEVACRQAEHIGGIVINPFTDNLVFKMPLVQRIEEVEKARKNAGKVKTMQLTPEQYVLFERKQFEFGFLPRRLFENGKEMMEQLQKKGFSILMDDFGSGYSSLNVLKDIAVDVLKIDMKFLDGSGDDGRSENILASVVRMAKWLNMPVVAEGAERKEQVSFLHSIGCEYVQGFYFARPMPVKEYEKLLYEQPYFEDDETRRTSNDTNAIWTANMQMEMIFSNMMQAAAIYEYSDGNIEVVRVNDAYFDMFGYHDTDRVHKEIEGSIDHVDRERFMDTFAQVVENQSTAECEVKRFLESGREIWIKLRLKYINRVGERHIIFGCIDDITVQREMDNELAKYRLALMEEEVNEKTMLVVHDMEINRASLESIFETDYRILQAGDGEEALRILEEQNYKVDMILLDLMMPGMNGQTFMQERKNDPRILNIPVVIITADDTTEQQVLTMELGASDYIVKPFIPEIVTRRVQNVWDSTRRKKEVLQEHQK